MATQSRIFPLFEVEAGRLSITVKPEKTLSVRDYLMSQGRFSQMSEDMVSQVQAHAERRWKDLLNREAKT